MMTNRLENTDAPGGIRPRCLWTLAQTCPDSKWLGDVIRALGGQEDAIAALDFGERQYYNMAKEELAKFTEAVENKRNQNRERQQKYRDSRKKGTIADGVTRVTRNNATNILTNTLTNTHTDKQSTKPNKASARDVQTAPNAVASGVASTASTFGLGEVSPEVKARAKSELDELRDTYLEQFSTAMKQAADCGDEDGPFYDKDVPAEYICCWVTGSEAVGTWKAYVHKLGEDAVRNECCTFFHECNAGENARNPAAALNARLKRLCAEKEGAC